MRTNRIREIIRHIRAESGQLARLRNLVRESIPRLHGAIQLPARNGEAVLADFIFRYIEHVPNFIDALRGLTREAGIYDYASIFLLQAEDFFLHPPAMVASRPGVDSLLHEAYLAHRLIEEVNDRVVARCGIPLAPMDMTRANLVVHQLIGEPFANDLDFVVLYSTESHINKEALMENEAFHRFVHERKARGWQTELNRWPCLAEDLSISLLFRADMALLLEEAQPSAIH
ncbi:hypothetical protein F6455_12155 [Proteobacteria bacterium 005FR1]|nr:hypothetical protein [Proteobacteria bacterium 005FR1]